jgi:hypothetical protein
MLTFSLLLLPTWRSQPVPFVITASDLAQCSDLLQNSLPLLLAYLSLPVHSPPLFLQCHFSIENPAFLPTAPLAPGTLVLPGGFGGTM